MEIQTPLVIFTLLLCLANGLMGFQGLMMVQRKGDNRFHLITLIVTAVVLVVGGLAVFTHLQHWERIFNGFGQINSGITHELILIVVMVVALVVAFVMAWRGREDGVVPSKAVGVAFIIIAVIGGFVTAHSYDMYARPAWNNLFLYLYYYASELILGAAGVWVLTAVLKQGDDVNALFGKLTLVMAVLYTVITVAAMFAISTIEPATIEGITFYTYDPTHPAVDPAADLAAAWSGASAGLFWGGAVVVGGIVPIVVAAVAAFRAKLAANPALPVVALVAALIGNTCYRIVLYVVGIASYVYFF
ncbi:dimethyl sulfoxide reductase anchor subunit [Adlercreutzia equolifaciens]|uniref:DmsC/YnfH family molybdoenzyme membrane anchor subunit n=1 Tax=Adlercreutzia equolifaciens TaxID=446660 RepID=UPI0023B04162|nr:DmsC/YnfH family molybdoenzyme membrane anchor subunit [Adlercreutzia equolifaciens]MDE8701723.1 dimethyl sulfoxide reductase anchor subunit [Adlercreutzia equolifaciens]